MRAALLPLTISACAFIASAGCASLGGPVPTPEQARARTEVLVRAQVWRPTKVEAMNLRRGPGKTTRAAGRF